MFITIGLLIHLKQTVNDEGMSKRIKVNKGSDLVLKKMFAFVTILIVSRFILKLTFIFRVIAQLLWKEKKTEWKVVLCQLVAIWLLSEVFWKKFLENYKIFCIYLIIIFPLSDKKIANSAFFKSYFTYIATMGRKIGSLNISFKS